MATLFKVPTENALQYTLASQLNAGATSLTLGTNVDGIVQAPGVLVIDRIDANGNRTPTKREFITFTTQSTTSISGLSRGLGGSSDQAHAAGAIVEFIPDVLHMQNLYDVITADHGVTGSHDVLTDSNGNELVTFTETASAVNQINITNAATGTTGPLISPEGETNIDLRLAGKGTGKVKADSSYGVITSNSDDTTVTFNLATSNVHTVTLGGNRTLALSNASVGQKFIIRLVQDGTGSRTVTWFSTIKWPGGTAPTLSTTAGSVDVFAFVCTSSGNYDGFIVGLNLS